MRAVFSLASKLSPCVLFIDEVDAMLSKRDSQREHEAHREIKNEFMAQWDGIRTGSSSSVDRVRAPLQICRLFLSDLGQQAWSEVTMAMIAFLSYQLAPVVQLQASLSYVVVLSSTLSKRIQHQDHSGLHKAQCNQFACLCWHGYTIYSCVFLLGDGPWRH